MRTFFPVWWRVPRDYGQVFTWWCMNFLWVFVRHRLEGTYYTILDQTSSEILSRPARISNLEIPYFTMTFFNFTGIDPSILLVPYTDNVSERTNSYLLNDFILSLQLLLYSSFTLVCHQETTYYKDNSWDCNSKISLD